MASLDNYPQKLIQKRNEVECNFIFSLWKNPEQFEEYKKVENGKDIITDDGMFYYGIAKQLYNLGNKRFDDITVYTFLEDKEQLKKGFEKRGGFGTVSEIMNLIDTKNIDSYYDELIKNNSLLNIYDELDVDKNYDKFSKMTSSQLYDYIDYKANNIFINNVEKLKSENISEGYESYIDEWDKGVMRGFTIGYPILNYRLAGVHKKNILLHLAHIGNGKTTSSILFYILPAIEHGENVCIIANEQDVNEFRQMILSTVLFNRVGYKKINRQRFIQGGFSAEDRENINKAADWLKMQEGKITFVETSDYSINNVKKIIRQNSKVGCGLFVFDTLKPEVENSASAWADFSETAKELFLLAKQEDVAIVATAQLSSESASRRFLDLSCVGKSRAISETASQVVMFRSMTDEEKEKLKVFNLKKDKETGKLTNVREIINLDPDKDYIILFTPKNRFGSVAPQIVYERNMAFNSMREIGQVQITYDGFGQRK